MTSRIDVIGQNGNDALHYPQSKAPKGAEYYCPIADAFYRHSGNQRPDQRWSEQLQAWQNHDNTVSLRQLLKLNHSGDANEKADHLPDASKKVSMAELYPDYYRDVRHLDEIDVYAVHDAFRVDDPSGCLQHASKKILLSGTRNGGKSLEQDIKEARDTLTRKLQLMGVE